ncbi:MAG: DUF4399 domain-containing protein [Nitrospinales bacterium]
MSKFVLKAGAVTFFLLAFGVTMAHADANSLLEKGKKMLGMEEKKTETAPAAAAPAVLPGTAAVIITSPANGSMVASPVLVCMAVQGVTVEPAKNGVNAGKGHHHILVDAAIPDLSKPVGKDATHIHMGDGSTCKALTLAAGTHVIRTLFAKGNHVPYDPALTATVIVTVK